MRHNRHDSILDDLEKRIRDSPVHYDVVRKKWEYRMNGGCGEIDLYAIKIGKNSVYGLLFEGKSTFTEKSYRTAIKQLCRANRCVIPKTVRLFAFMAYGSGKEQHYYIRRIKLEKYESRR